MQNQIRANQDSFTGLNKYRELLVKAELALAKCEQVAWPSKLREWVTEFDHIQALNSPLGGYAKHVRRTHDSFSGMGSLNDITACKRSESVAVFKTFWRNRKLRRLLSALFEQTSEILERLETRQQ